MLKCPKCSKIYQYNSGLSRHLKSHSSNNYECHLCNRNFSRKYCLDRHLKTCQSKQVKNVEVSELMPENEQLEMAKKYNMSKDDVNKFMSVSHGIANVNNSDVNNNSNNTINSHNQKNNNIQIIVKLGDEDLENVFTPVEQRKILNQRYNALEYLIKYTHFNDQYPKFQNITIEDIKSKYAQLYDEDKENFILTDRDKLIDDLIEFRLNDIVDFLKLNSNFIGIRTKNIIKQHIEKLETEFNKDNSKYIKDKKESLKLVIYNESSAIKKKKLKLKSQKVK